MNPSEWGYLQKIEPFGTVDGPGIRTVLFFAGCPLRCLYCHNPETWQAQRGEYLAVETLLSRIRRYVPYYGQLGGVTFSGGEPLMQAPFLLSCIKAFKAAGIHTALDTSGFGNHLVSEIVQAVDLIIYDLKSPYDDEYQALTGQSKAVTDAFLQKAQAAKTPLWIRQVLVPGRNDSPRHLEATAQAIAKLEHVERVEILPYHTMGSAKYEKLDLAYPLEGVPAMSLPTAKAFETALLERIETLRKENTR
jgi:pyruvate formate lyase activating enzyme